jgi:hypothetical protein
MLSPLFGLSMARAAPASGKRAATGVYFIIDG